MAVSVRAVDLDGELEALLAILERDLTDLSHARRFKWMYRDHPLGSAWSWFAWDDGTKQAVGVASVFRRAVWLGTKVALCGQVGDFAIDASHRSLGPALMLQRATFDPVDRGVLALCYDCPPHDRGMATFRRLGMKAGTTMARHARLLRADRHLARRLGMPIATRMAPLVNAALRLARPSHRADPGLVLAVHTERFGEEFSVLDRRVGGGDGIRGRRAAEDLNWRFRDDPLNDYYTLTARRRGELEGFAVVSAAGPDPVLVDLFGVLSPGDTLALLEAAVERARATGGETLHTTLSEANPLIPTLARSGFRRRERGPMVVAYAGAGDPPSLPAAWTFTHADVMA